MRTLVRLFFIINLLVFGLTACGYRGALYLPKQAPAPSTTSGIILDKVLNPLP